ncbi:nucleotidyl transferase AbiEii/AbiGii toxin family protein [Streptomyces sp. 5K101]|uniref:nucleotidyl transferase AbiEii/AbiGii toxin family protein n=1 Tax=Streptomyces sp. 5K101 TaxID=3390037 RepID=UPI003976D52E
MTQAGRRPIPGGPEDLAESRADIERRTTELPRTLRVGMDHKGAQHLVFDPALKHFTRAFRPLDAVTPDAAAWRSARRAALDTVLAAVSRSGWADSLVLRGSMLMAAWFPGEAREPKDLDFVVVPADWNIEEERTGTMLAGIASAAQRAAQERGGPLTIDAGGAESEYIWTYDRVPGRRMVLPWSVPGLPDGQVQLDFVFNEHLPEEPVRTTVAGTELRTAGPELSLAWKVQWLLTDCYAQGKDLYDAALLAERHPLCPELLHEVFRLTGEWPYPYRKTVLFEDVEEAVRDVEWDHFAADYPQFADDERVYAQRLLTALAPTFAHER